MNNEQLRLLLEAVRDNKADITEAMNQIKTLPYHDLDYAKVDYHREIRSGFPEVIYSPGKTLTQIQGIVKDMLERTDGNILASRADRSVYEAVCEITDEAIYYEAARSVVVKRKPYGTTESSILVVTAGTSDIPVAEEAAQTAEYFGTEVERIYDIGVSGMHRLFSKLEIIQKANCVVAVAGMEGALASVLGGLVSRPVIAVPTSVGYGANFGGMSALLTMINSCANGVAVVNIDNGYGAGYLATQINRLAAGKGEEA